MAPYGTSLYFTILGMLSFISSDLHTIYSQLFNPSIEVSLKELMKEKLQTKLRYIDSDILFDNRPYICGTTFSVADAYLFVVLSWSTHADIDIEAFKYITRYCDRIASLPFVSEAFETMGHSPAATLHV